MPFSSEKEITDLINAFRNRTLPSSEWTHQAHLTTAVWFNMKYSKLEALCYLRSGIISYNMASGGENTPEKGYHETLTIFWIHIIHKFVKSRNLPVLNMVNEFLNSEWASREVPLKYYSKERLFSLEARAMWVEPDLVEMEWGD